MDIEVTVNDYRQMQCALDEASNVLCRLLPSSDQRSRSVRDNLPMTCVSERADALSTIVHRAVPVSLL